MKRPAGKSSAPRLGSSPSHRLSSVGLGEVASTVGEGFLGMAVQLAAMVLVERRYGASGLGVYSYLIAFFHLAAYLADFGISRWVERETALLPGQPERTAAVWGDAVQAQVLVGLVVAALCCLSASYDTSLTRIQEKVASYVVIGAAIPIRNGAKLRLAALHGLGKHQEVAKLEAGKRLTFLATLAIGAFLSFSPSLLVGSVLVSELVLLFSTAGRVSMPFPRVSRGWTARVRQTLKECQPLVFSDQAFELILYIDLVVLGIYLQAGDLGVYAETSFMARLFLLVPLSLRPVFRQKYCAAIGDASCDRAMQLFRKLSTVLFSAHSFFALIILLFYSELLGAFFTTQGEELLSFRLFEILLPGLVLCSSVMASEPLYEALGVKSSLRRLVTNVLTFNVAINLYLVRSFGYYGAATATLLATALYFLLFGSGLPDLYRPSRLKTLWGGAAAYVVFALMRYLKIQRPWTIWLLPVLFGLAYYCIGYFDTDARRQSVPTKGDAS